MASLRSMLCLFVAALSLFAFDSAEATYKKKRHVSFYKCGTKGKSCCRGYKCGEWLNCKKVYWWWKYGHCVACGDKGQHPCKHGGCKGKLVENQHGKCDHPPCGAEHETCCEHYTCDNDWLICKKDNKHGTCVGCGKTNDHCCAGHKCKNEHDECVGGKCVPKCGGEHEKCCKGHKCDNAWLVCKKGGKYPTCVGCGKTNDHCCAGDKCKKHGDVCKHGKCVTKCGGKHEPCCEHHTCRKGFKCNKHKNKCVRACGRKWQRCCKGYWCKWGLKCKHGYCKPKRRHYRG